METSLARRYFVVPRSNLSNPIPAELVPFLVAADSVQLPEEIKDDEVLGWVCQ